MTDTIKAPQLQLKVEATAKWNKDLKVIGYYYFDKVYNQHYICTYEGLNQIEIDKDTVKFKL
jgi:hypothetical protein